MIPNIPTGPASTDSDNLEWPAPRLKPEQNGPSAYQVGRLAGGKLGDEFMAGVVLWAAMDLPLALLDDPARVVSLYMAEKSRAGDLMAYLQYELQAWECISRDSPRADVVEAICEALRGFRETSPSLLAHLLRVPA